MGKGKKNRTNNTHVSNNDHASVGVEKGKEKETVEVSSLVKASVVTAEEEMASAEQLSAADVASASDFSATTEVPPAAIVVSAETTIPERVRSSTAGQAAAHRHSPTIASATTPTRAKYYLPYNDPNDSQVSTTHDDQHEEQSSPVKNVSSSTGDDRMNIPLTSQPISANASDNNDNREGENDLWKAMEEEIDETIGETTLPLETSSPAVTPSPSLTPALSPTRRALSLEPPKSVQQSSTAARVNSSGVTHIDTQSLTHILHQPQSFASMAQSVIERQFVQLASLCGDLCVFDVLSLLQHILGNDSLIAALLGGSVRLTSSMAYLLFFYSLRVTLWIVFLPLRLLEFSIRFVLSLAVALLAVVQ